MRVDHLDLFPFDIDHGSPVKLRSLDLADFRATGPSNRLGTLSLSKSRSPLSPHFTSSPILSVPASNNSSRRIFRDSGAGLSLPSVRHRCRRRFSIHPFQYRTPEATLDLSGNSRALFRRGWA